MSDSFSMLDERLTQNVIADAMMAMSVGRPTSQAKITGVVPDPEPLGVGSLLSALKDLIPPKPVVIEEWWAEPGYVYRMETGVGPVWIVHPTTWLDIRFPNRHPRYTLGHAEARRDQRKYPR